MKIAITGHSSGIGAATYKKFTKEGHEVYGFSRSNGWDLTINETRQKFIDELKKQNFDVFINNAYPYQNYKHMEGFLQVELLNQAWLLWENLENKIIVTIGSNSSEIVKNYYHPYNVHKKAVDETCKQLRNTRDWPLVINMKPEYVDTRVVKNVNAKKMQPADVADMIYFAVTHRLKVYDIMFGAR